MNHFNYNSYVADRQSNSNNGTNYSQNILNYNNSFYRINNINNYNYIKNQSTSPSSHFNRDNYYSKQHDKYLLNDKMEREETVVECSQLVNNGRDANGRNVTIHNFTSNNVASHTTIPPSYNNADEEEEQQQQSASPPIHRSQHFTQVSLMRFVFEIMRNHEGAERKSNISVELNLLSWNAITLCMMDCEVKIASAGKNRLEIIKKFPT